MWLFAVLESVHAIHLLHAVCTGLEEVLERSSDDDRWSTFNSSHEGRAAEVDNATSLMPRSITYLPPSPIEPHACSSEFAWEKQDCESVAGWSTAEGPAEMLSTALLSPFAQLAAVLLFELIMNTSTRYSRSRTSKALLGALFAVVASVAGYERMYASPLDRSFDLSRMLSSAENLCLPLHLVLQIILESAHGQQLCREHLQRTGRTRRCSGERRASKSQ